MSSRPRDNQRARLYRAEREAAINCLSTTSALLYGSEPTDGFRSVSEIEAYCLRLIRSRRFQSRWPNIKGVRIKDGRGTRFARGGCHGSVASLNLPLWARNEWTILHELSHCVTPKNFAPHGPEFADNFLTLVHHQLGREAEDRLIAAFLRHRVKSTIT